MIGNKKQNAVETAEQYAEANIVCQAGNAKAPVPTGEKVFVVPEDHVVEKEKVTQWVEHTPVEREYKTTVAPTGVVNNLGVHVEPGVPTERIIGEHTCFPTNTSTISGVAGITTSERRDVEDLGRKMETSAVIDDKHHSREAIAAPVAAPIVAEQHHTPAVAAAAPVAAAFVSSGMLGNNHNKLGKDFVAGSVPEYGAQLTPGDSSHVPGTVAGGQYGLPAGHPSGAQPGVGVISGSHIDKNAPRDIRHGQNANLDMVQNPAADQIGPVPGYAQKAVNFVTNLLPGHHKTDVTDGKLNGGALAVAEHGADGTLGANTTTVTDENRNAMGLVGNDAKGHSPLPGTKKH